MMELLFNLFLVLLGTLIGVFIMCLLQIGKTTDNDFETVERRNRK